jgi:predicted membrane-bound spermidine synthase
MSRYSRFVAPAALLIFALSGCAGLIYQSIWTQYLGLFLGHAAYAQSLVLAIFMGGMSVGAYWVSARGGRWRNLLRAYAWIELIIGVAAAIFHDTYLVATRFAYDIAFPALAGGAAAEVFKWTFAALLIFPQAALLGATFPLMSTGLMRRVRTGDGAILSGLYFTNSLGAAIGALLATFVLLPAMGLPGAMRFGAALNVAVAAVAFVLARRPEALPEAPSETFAIRSGDSALLLGAAFVTGATSFVYEIGWVRMQSLVFGSTVHAFELMLAAFIGGLAFGGLWIRQRIDHYREPIRAGGYVQVCMGLAALASLIAYDHTFDAVAWLMNALTRSDSGYTIYNWATGAGALLIMAPTAFFAGMTLPLFTLALMRQGGREASVGRVYAANTIGAIVGVFAAVHLLLPLLGLKLTMLAAAALDLGLGIVLLGRPRHPHVSRPRFAVLAVCGAALAATLLLARFDPMAMAGGVYRSGLARLKPETSRVLFYRDGKTASVASMMSNGSTMIATNGKVDASMQLAEGRPPAIDETTMVMLAALPLAFHSAPHTAGVIGFGSGLSTHVLLGDRRLGSVDTIEIEPSMVAGARVFGERNARAYADPRSHVRFDDAKAYFASTQVKYDIIVSEPSNPWVSGVANLFSREFYAFVPRHLNSGGLFVQWIQAYEINDELVAMIVRSLAESFADFRIYLVNDDDIIVIATPTASLGPVQEAVFHEPQLQKELARVGLDSPASLAMREVGDRHSLAPLLDLLSSRSNSDFYPLLSLEAPRSRFARTNAHVMKELNAADLPIREIVAGLPPPAETSAVDMRYTPSALANEAAAIAADLSDTPSLATKADGALSRDLAFARAEVGGCGHASSMAQIDTLIELAGKTIPYLSAPRLQGIWSAPRWITCTNQPVPVRLLLDVLDALSARDFAKTSTAATALLEQHRNVLSPVAQDWLLRTVMLAAIAQHRYEEATNADRELGGDIVPNQITQLQRSYLLAFADAQLLAQREGATRTR